MKKFSRITAVILAVVILFGVIMIAPFSAGAATSAWKTEYINYVNKMSTSINNGDGWGCTDIPISRLSPIKKVYQSPNQKTPEQWHISIITPTPFSN